MQSSVIVCYQTIYCVVLGRILDVIGEPFSELFNDDLKKIRIQLKTSLIGLILRYIFHHNYSALIISQCNKQWFSVFDTVFEFERVISSTQKFLEHETQLRSD